MTPFVISPFLDGDYQTLKKTAGEFHVKMVVMSGVILLAGAVLPFMFFGEFSYLRMVYFVIILSCIAAIFYLPQMRNLMRDRSQGKKICGTFVPELTINVLRSRVDFYLTVRMSDRYYKIQVPKEVYDKISSGEQVYMEFAKNSAVLLKLERDGQPITVGY